MIELKNVKKIFANKTTYLHALKNINLSVATGEIFGVIGRSGAGKSTLIRCVNLLERPSKGHVYVANKELTNLSEKKLRIARRKIGIIFQHFNLLGSRTVYQNIALPLELQGYTKTQIQNIITPLIEFTGLSEKQKNYPSQLSGGQKQRVAIARALASQPDVLLCDEATSALDLQTTKNILSLLKEINAKLNLTILLITHEMDVIKELTDKVALLENGEIIEQAETSDFFINPKTKTAQDLVRSCLKQELPISLQTRLMPQAENHNPVLQILFHGKAAEEPLITHLGYQFGIKLSILQANIEFLKHTTLGVMVAEVIDKNNNLENAIEYLQANHVKVEIIGYVKRDMV